MHWVSQASTLVAAKDVDISHHLNLSNNTPTINLPINTRAPVHLYNNCEKKSDISSETGVPGVAWITPTKYFWLRVFGAPIIYVIPVH